jgi:hypothetical protein
LAGFIFGDPMQEVPILVVENEPTWPNAAQLTKLGFWHGSLRPAQIKSVGDNIFRPGADRAKAPSAT